MITKTKITALFILLTVSTSWAQEKETRKLADFSDLRVAEGIHVTLKKGSSNTAEISARGVDLDEVLTDVSGDRLKIHLDNGRHNNVNVNITLTYKELERLEASSAAHVNSEGAIKAGRFDIEVSSAGEVDVALDCTELTVDVSSAGELFLRGNVDSQEVEVSSAGDYDGEDLVAKTTYVRVSSAGSARVHASEQIDAAASSGGSLRYFGNPDKVRQSESSGGSVKSSN